MPTRHPFRAFLPFALLFFVLAPAVGAPRLVEAPPPDVDLSGKWVLNPERSDVPSERIAAALKYPAPPRMRGPGGGGPRERGFSDHHGHGGGGGRGDTGGTSGTANTGDTGAWGGEREREPRDDAGHRVGAPEAEVLVPAGRTLTVTQAPDALDFAYEDDWSAHWPHMTAEHAVVERQDATVTTGWDGGRYVVYAELKNGLTLIERYALSADRKQLMVGSEIRFPRRDVGAEILRVFDRAP